MSSPLLEEPKSILKKINKAQTDRKRRHVLYMTGITKRVSQPNGALLSGNGYEL